MLSDKCLQRYRLLENSNIEILLLQDVLDFDLLEEQSDLGLHCLLFHLHHLEVNTKVEPLSLNFRVLTVKLVGV